MCGRAQTRFTAMTEEALLFWLPNFVAEMRKSDGSLYPPNSGYQICCGLSRALKSANRVVQKRSKLRMLPTQIQAIVSPNAAVWVKPVSGL